MRISPRPRTLLTAGACTLLLGLAIPSAAVTAAAGAVRPTPAPAVPNPAVPNPHAPHTGTVPGLTGAAARRADPPQSASARWKQLNTASHRAARGPAGPVRADGIKPSLTSWTGAFHGYWGTFPSPTVYGAQAMQSLNPNLKLPSTSPDTIYSPTLDPSGLTCIEMSTIYVASTDEVGAWDWCAASPGFAKVSVINSSFLSTYTTTVSGQPFYSVQDVQTNPTTNSWTSYLYNYSTGAWNSFYTSANTSKLGNSGGGWDMSEVYTNYNSSTSEGDYCSQASGSNLESNDLEYQLSSGGSWVSATTSNSSLNLAEPRGADLGCAVNDYWLPTANDNWKVTNGTNGPAEIIGGGSSKCVDTNGGVFANGTEEQIYTCHSGTGQEWTWNSLGQLTVDGGKYCLEAKGQGTSPGTVVDLWSCNGGTNQEWTFTIKHMLVGEQSGLCLGVKGGGTGNGTALELETCTDATSQQWSWS
jgi:Ricin-type beta-trefoil lectin domain